MSRHENFYPNFCNNLETYFKPTHQLLTKQQIPTFYIEIHNLFMKLFKKEPVNLIQILNEPLWLNKHIIVNSQYLYDKDFEKKGIYQLKDILDNICAL